MRTLLLTLGLLPAFAMAASPADQTGLDTTSKSCVTISTSQGNIGIELEPSKAPLTVANFLQYVDEGFYDDTLFHRVIASFMVQGGGFDTNAQQKRTQKPVRNESGNGLSNTRGTLAMARTNDPHSATTQFFINLVDNPHLDYRSGQYGYAVFGQVVSGMTVVDAIGAATTHVGSLNGYGVPNVPIQPILIKSVSHSDCASS